MYRIEKEFSFEASHRLEGMPEGHQCARLHGHSYRVRVVLAADTLDGRGFVVDYGDLKPFRDYIDQNLDHRHLNDVLSFQPSAENIAKHLFGWCHGRWPQTVEVWVSETAKTWASYSEGA